MMPYGYAFDVSCLPGLSFELVGALALNAPQQPLKFGSLRLDFGDLRGL